MDGDELEGMWNKRYNNNHVLSLLKSESNYYYDSIVFNSATQYTLYEELYVVYKELNKTRI